MVDTDFGSIPDKEAARDPVAFLRRINDPVSHTRIQGLEGLLREALPHIEELPRMRHGRYTSGADLAARIRAALGPASEELGK